MAKTVRDASLDSRAARSRLKIRSKPYYRLVDVGLHLGYRKGVRAGVWVARLYIGDQRYTVTTIGTADDILDADGVAALSFAQAQAKARDLFAAKKHDLAEIPRDRGPYRVKDAMADYCGWVARSRQSAKDVRWRTAAFVVPALGKLDCAQLSARSIQKWLNELADSPARRRTKNGLPQKFKETAGDADAVRKRRASANRCFTILRAALNRAFRDGKVASDVAWRRVQAFRNVDAPVIRYLSEAECRRLVNATAAPFRPMIIAALLSGARYGELASLRASDYSADAGTLAIRESKSGKPRHVVLTDEGRAFFANAAAGKLAADLMLPRPDGAPWGKSHQARFLRSACQRGKIEPAVSFHVLRHTYGSTLAQRGAPMPVIAQQLGHAGTRMTEKHYAHLSPSYVAHTVRASFPNLGIVNPADIPPMEQRRSLQRGA